MSLDKPPEAFDFDRPNISAAWKTWKQRFLLFMKATESAAKPQDVKVAILLTVLGERGVDIYNNFDFAQARGAAGQDGYVPAEDEENYDTVLHKFDEYCNKRDPIMSLRAQFWCYERPEGQGLNEYVNDLRTMATNCKFVEFEGTLRDKLFFSIKDPMMKMKVMGDDGNASLSSVINRMRTYESAKTELQMAVKARSVHVVQDSEQGTESVHAVHGYQRRGQHRGGQRSRGSGKSGRGGQRGGHSQRGREGGNQANSCRSCGRVHGPRQCPAYGQVCHKCNATGHFARKCPSNVLHTVDYEEHECLYLDSVENVHAIEDSWYSVVQVDADQVKMKLDTGVTINVLPLRVYCKLTNKRKLIKTRENVYGYGRKPLDHLGYVTLRCQAGRKTGFYQFYVMDVTCPPLLGRAACEERGLVMRGKQVHTLTHPLTKESLIQEYSEQFSGLGRFAKPYDAKLDPEAHPVIHPLRRVPLSLQGRLKKQLDLMEAEDVIMKRDGPTDWVSSLVVVGKKWDSATVSRSTRLEQSNQT